MDKGHQRPDDEVTSRLMAENPPWWKSRIHPMSRALNWPEVGKGALKTHTRKRRPKTIYADKANKQTDRPI